MFSLQVAFILALSIQFDNNAVSGYAVDIPFTVTSIEDSSSVESNFSYETTTPCPAETLLNTPVIETTTAPTYDEFDALPDRGQFAVVQQNFNITGPSTNNRKRTSCLCKECNPENGFYIKHFRQYNYYYPHGRGLGHHMPHHMGLFSSEDFLPHDSVPFASSIVSANNVNVVSSSKKSSRPTVRFSPPGVASYVPNNGFNSIYHNHQSSAGARRQSEYATSSSASEENSSQNGEQTSSDETAEQTSSQSSLQVEAATTIPLDDNVSEDIISYLSEPNVFGHAEMTTHTNDNGHNFQSQRVSLSSRVQSQSQSPPQPFGEEDSEAQQQIGVSSRADVQRSQTSEYQQQVGPSSSIHQSSSESNRQESVSSNTQHQSQPASSSKAEQQQQQVSVSSKTQSPTVSSSESQQQQNKVSSSTYQSLNWPSYASSSIGDVNFGSSDSMTIGYNPYYQSPPFGVFPVVQPTLPPVPVSGLKKPMNWQGRLSKSTSTTTPHPQHKPNTCQYCNNRIRNWPNYSLPPPPPPPMISQLPQFPQLPLFDFTNMPPSYSVIL